MNCVNPECFGYLECDGEFCVRVCSDFCKNGEGAVCDRDACADNPCEESVSCIMNCGDCTSIHFDASGNQVCLNDVNTVNECSIEGDCSKEEYCASGVCLPNGSCNTDLDCMNLENVYLTTRCLGYLKCKEGRCSNVCSETCENGMERMTCDPAACKTNPCEASISCVENCSDCSAIHFDRSGKQVCVDDEAMRMSKKGEGIEAEAEPEVKKVESEPESQNEAASMMENGATRSVLLTAWCLSLIYITFELV